MRLSLSRSFSSCVFWQVQHRAFSTPVRSDLVGLVFSSMSWSSDGGIQIGIFKSVGDNKPKARTKECLVKGRIQLYVAVTRFLFICFAKLKLFQDITTEERLSSLA